MKKLKTLPRKSKSTVKPSPIVKELIKARESLGLSKAGVADAMGKHLSQVIVIESGKTAMPTFAFLQAYAKAVGGEMVMEFRKKSARQ